MTHRNEDTVGPDVAKMLSNKDFLTYGVHDIAYVRPIVVDSKKAYAIHAADGTPLSVMESEQSAFNTIRNNDMDVVLIH